MILEQNDLKGFQEIGIYLAPDFPLYGLVPLIETFRIANQNAGRRLYNWRFITDNGEAVMSGAGTRLSPDTNIFSNFLYDLVFIFSGNDPTSYLSRRLNAWLQMLVAHGAVLGGIDTGAFALAEAGLLNGRRATSHWEVLPLLCERYPEIELVEQRYVIDLPIITCAGGMAVLDMVLELVERAHGAMLARQIKNGFVYPNGAKSDGPQRHISAETNPGQKGLVSRTISLMEANIEEPLSVDEIAHSVGVPRRKLERVFRQRTQSSVARYYSRVRLELARETLFYTEESIANVSLMCGFSSPSVFNRSFKTCFGTSPGNFRASYSTLEMARFRPHVAWSLDISSSGKT